MTLLVLFSNIWKNTWKVDSGGNVNINYFTNTDIKYCPDIFRESPNLY